MRFPRKLKASFILAALLLPLCGLLSCSKKAGTGASAANTDSVTAPLSDTPSQFYVPKGAVFDVKYTDNTVRIDLATVQKTLRSVSNDGRVMVFEASDPRLVSLEKGKVLLLEHVGVRKILGVLKQGSQIALATDNAGLTDFIQDGRIEFSAPLDLQMAHAQAMSPRAERNPLARIWDSLGLQGVVHADGACGNPKESRAGLQFKGEVDNWEFEVEGEPEGGNLLFCFNAAKKLSSLTASVKAKGELEHINTTFKAVIHGGKMQDFEYESPIDGKLAVTWAALTSGAGAGIGEARLKFPPFWKDVIDIYGLPFLFQANGNLIFKPGFGGKHDAASGGFDINYHGSGGLSVHGNQSTPQGQMSGEPNMEKTTSESMAAHGVVIAVAAPKVTMSLGTDSFLEALKKVAPKGLLDKAAEGLEGGPFAALFKDAQENFFTIKGGAYLQLVTEFDYAGSGPLSLVPCSMTHLNMMAQAGADATLLALSAGSPRLDLFKTSKVAREPDIPACGQK